MSQQPWALLLGAYLAIGPSSAHTTDQPVYYVPIVFVEAAHTVGPDGNVSSRTFWKSNLSGFNQGPGLGYTTYLAAYGPGVRVSSPGRGCYFPFELPALYGWPFENVSGGCVDGPASGPGFLVFSATRNMVFSAEISREIYRTCGDTLYGPYVAGQGRAQLPIYTSLFPAGSTATSGPVVQGAPHLFDAPGCFSSNQKYIRRINVTLFNAGDRPATFTISARHITLSNEVIFDESYALEAKEVRQLNDVPIPLIDAENYRDGDAGIRVWINITADQPFLSYASSVFENGEPGSLPFEVFPSRLAPQ